MNYILTPWGTPPGAGARGMVMKVECKVYGASIRGGRLEPSLRSGNVIIEKSCIKW